MKKEPIDVSVLEDCVTRAKYVTVPRKEYFELLVECADAVFTDNMFYDSWEEFHSKRVQDTITIRRLYLEKMLSAYEPPSSW